MTSWHHLCCCSNQGTLLPCAASTVIALPISWLPTTTYFEVDVPKYVQIGLPVGEFTWSGYSSVDDETTIKHFYGFVHPSQTARVQGGKLWFVAEFMPNGGGELGIYDTISETYDTWFIGGLGHQMYLYAAWLSMAKDWDACDDPPTTAVEFVFRIGINSLFQTVECGVGSEAVNFHHRVMCDWECTEHTQHYPASLSYDWTLNPMEFFGLWTPCPPNATFTYYPQCSTASAVMCPVNEDDPYPPTAFPIIDDDTYATPVEFTFHGCEYSQYVLWPGYGLTCWNEVVSGLAGCLA